MKKKIQYSADGLSVMMLGAMARAYSGALGAMGQERERGTKIIGKVNKKICDEFFEGWTRLNVGVTT